MTYRMKNVCGSLLVFLTWATTEENALGAGKKPSPDTPVAPVYTTPNPIRAAILKPVGTMPFQLPNGGAVNLNVKLDDIFATVVTEDTASFVPMTLTPDPVHCDSWLQIIGSVTTLELKIAELGITFGYNPGGTISPTNFNGTGKLTIGAMTMDFGVQVCRPGKGCEQVIAAYSTEVTANVNMSVQANFSQIKTTADLFLYTPLEPALRKMMKDSMTQISQSQKFATLPWEAAVQDYDPAAGLVFFDAGLQSRVGVNQTFEIDAMVPSTGTCPVYRKIANIHTTDIGQVSSTAMVDLISPISGRSPQIQRGDVVMIRTAPAKP